MSCILSRNDSILVNRERSSTVRVSFPSIVRTWIHIVAPLRYASIDWQTKRGRDANVAFWRGWRRWKLKKKKQNKKRLGVHCVFLCSGSFRLARAGGVSHEVAAPSKSRDMSFKRDYLNLKAQRRRAARRGGGSAVLQEYSIRLTLSALDVSVLSVVFCLQNVFRAFVKPCSELQRRISSNMMGGRNTSQNNSRQLKKEQ